MSRRNAVPRNESEALDRERALAVVARMRRENTSLGPAAKVEEVDPSIVLLYAGSAFKKKRPRGRYRAKPYDRIPRTLNFLTSKGSQALTVRDSRTASRIGEYMNAVRKYLHSGDTSILADFEGRSFRSGGVTHRFITDTRTLDQFADAGGLAIEGLYRAVRGG